MFKMFQIKLNKKGFTLMELVVSTAIMGTLAAVAIPSFVEQGQAAKGAKSLDNINNIGAALLSQYALVAGEGDATEIVNSTPSAIATFNEDLNSTQGTGDPILNTETVVFYASGTGADVITWNDLLPAGIPVSPFDGVTAYAITASVAGYADWTLTGGTVQLTNVVIPLITIHDPTQPEIQNTFTP